RIRPLTELMQKDCKDIPAQWGERQQKAFDDIKQALLSSPILCHFDPYLPVVVKADASDVAVGGAICQKQKNGAVLPIAYASRMLSRAERNYTITEKEALAVIWLLEGHRPYLYGTDVTIETDHQALKWLEQTPAKQRGGRVARWFNTLNEYKASWCWKPGRSHVVADFFSRDAAARAPTAADEAVVDVATYSIAPVDWRSAQLQQQDLREMIEHLEAPPSTAA